MDINMPIMDGIECLKLIKESNEHKVIPVIMLTTSENENTRKECEELGAVEYIQKPFSMNKMVASIKTSLEHLSLI